jgi:hypothetical protein
MRLHTDVIVPFDIEAAAKRAGVKAHFTPHGSRKRKHAFEVRLEGSGVEGGGWGTLNHKSGTWDEWGMFLAALYRIDSEMIAGPYLHNHEDEYDSFDFLTGDRYSELKPADQHKRHRWTFAGHYPTYGFMPGMAASYSEQVCKCGATRRWIVNRVKAVPLSA